MRERRELQRMERTSLSVRIIALQFFFFSSFQFPFVFNTILVARCTLHVARCSLRSSSLVRTANEQMLFECFIILSALAGAGAGRGPGLGLYKLFTDRLISTGPRLMQHALIFGSQGPQIARGEVRQLCWST